MCTLTDSFIREDEWRLISQYEELKQSCEYNTQEVQRRLNDHADTEGAQQLQRAILARKQVDVYIESLVNFAARMLRLQQHLNVLESTRHCYQLLVDELQVAEIGRRVCFFTQRCHKHLWRVRFRCLDAQHSKLTESPSYVVSRSYLMLLRSWYVLTHTAHYLAKTVEAGRAARSTEDRAAVDTASERTRTSINNAARYIFLFFTVVYKPQTTHCSCSALAG